MQKIHLVIAEGRTLFRQGLAALLCAEPDLVVVGEAGNNAEARQVCARLMPDVILLDASLPNTEGGDCLEAIPPLRVCCPESVILVIGEAGVIANASENEAERAAQTERRRALQMGAAACVRVVADHGELVRIIRELAARRALAIKDLPEPEGTPDSTETGLRHPLSERERMILALLTQGLCNKEIAHRLGIRPQTVKNHISHLFDKLDLADRVQLAVYALKNIETEES